MQNKDKSLSRESANDEFSMKTLNAWLPPLLLPIIMTKIWGSQYILPIFKKIRGHVSPPVSYTPPAHGVQVYSFTNMILQVQYMCSVFISISND